MYSPPLDEFLKLAALGNLIPVTRRILADFETPLSAYRKISGQGESFLFESVEGGEHIGRYSFVGCTPRAVIKQTENRVEVIENGKVVETFLVGGTGVPPVVSGVAPETVGNRTDAPQSPIEQRSTPPDEIRRDAEFGQAGRLCHQHTVRDGLEVVERVMKKYRAVAVPGLPRFTGGAVGFIGYEFIHDVEPVVPRPPHDEYGQPSTH